MGDISASFIILSYIINETNLNRFAIFLSLDNFKLRKLLVMIGLKIITVQSLIFSVQFSFVWSQIYETSEKIKQFVAILFVCNYIITLKDIYLSYSIFYTTRGRRTANPRSIETFIQQQHRHIFYK